MSVNCPRGLLVDLIRDVPTGDFRHRLGPGQSGPLLPAEERRLTSGVERILQPLLALTVRSGALGVHIKAEHTSVDLRDPELHLL